LDKEERIDFVKRAIVILAVVFVCGCRSIPFKQTSYAPLDGVDPRQVSMHFAQRLPQRFEVINSTVFAYRHMKFSCLGPTRVDVLNKSISAVGLNHMGVKLFELSSNNELISSNYVLPELTKHGDFAKAVCEDIKRIYLDRVPPAESKVSLGKRKLIFRAPDKNGFLEYVFAGKDTVLVEKNHYVNGRKLWSVFYYEYIVKNGKLFPVGIILRNYGFNYYLVVRLKEICESE